MSGDDAAVNPAGTIIDPDAVKWTGSVVMTDEWFRSLPKDGPGPVVRRCPD